MKITILVTHLLGTGHLARALTLARAFVDAGHHAQVLSGGLPAPHLDARGLALVQLPPLQSDGINFTRLLRADGSAAGGAYLAARQTDITQAIADHLPDVFITELFPFGRRVLRAEFLAAIAAARGLSRPPLICASIRDILAPPSKPEKARATEDILQEHYDAVLVHSDAGITPLEVSWPVTPDLAAKLRYTGFVAPPSAPPHPDKLGQGEVLVSAGGGNVGADVFAAALDAARIDPARFWRLLVGGNEAPQRIAMMKHTAPSNVRIEAARPDFRQMLHHATASVSMAGYNTALDLLQSGVPAVLVPFDAGGEVEQSLRAEALSRLDGIALLPTTDLSGAALLEGLRQVTGAPDRRPRADGLHGAAETVRAVQQLLEDRDAD